MAGSTLGTIFKITTWGESHGKGLGVVVDGCPAGLVALRGGYPAISRPQETGTIQIHDPKAGI